MEYKGLPLFSLDVCEEVSGVELISLVDFPAIERDFVKFAKENEIKFKVNEEKHVISGPALIPEQKIYRRDPNGKEYYVQFSREAIERVAVKFFKDRHSADANVMHEVDVEGVVYFESYLLNSERGIQTKEFADLPDGTWIVSAKIENPQLWQLIKEGVVKGFSIEGHMAEEEPEISTIEELIDYINKIK